MNGFSMVCQEPIDRGRGFAIAARHWERTKEMWDKRLNRFLTELHPSGEPAFQPVDMLLFVL
jgi:hypothetical protein